MNPCPVCGEEGGYPGGGEDLPWLSGGPTVQVCEDGGWAGRERGDQSGVLQLQGAGSEW